MGLAPAAGARPLKYTIDIRRRNEAGRHQHVPRRFHRKTLVAVHYAKALEGPVRKALDSHHPMVGQAPPAEGEQATAAAVERTALEDSGWCLAPYE